MLYNPMLFEHQYKNKLSRPMNVTFAVPQSEEVSSFIQIHRTHSICFTTFNNTSIHRLKFIPNNRKNPKYMNDMFQSTDSSNDEIYGLEGESHANGKRNRFKITNLSIGLFVSRIVVRKPHSFAT